eukprot:7932534-Pyramimonas_sp.AAC.1
MERSSYYCCVPAGALGSGAAAAVHPLGAARVRAGVCVHGRGDAQAGTGRGGVRHHEPGRR